MHPARHFIKYLISMDIEDSKKDEWIVGVLEEFGLFEKLATPEVLSAIRREMEIPANYQPSSRTHQPSIKFQKDHRIRDMHRMTKVCKRACQLRNNAAAREFAEQLLLAMTPYAQVARHVNKRCRTKFTKEDVSLFAHYFFDVEAIPRSLWSTAIKKRAGSLVFKAAIRGDTDLVLWRAGERVQVDINTALERLFTQSVMRLAEIETMPTNMATMKMLQCGADSMLRTFQAMTESDVRMKDVLTQLQQFQQRRREINILPATALGEGSFQLEENDSGNQPMLPPSPELKA